MKKLLFFLITFSWGFRFDSVTLATACERNSLYNQFYAPGTVLKPTDLTPARATILKRVRGDLNHDGFEDLVLIVDLPRLPAEEDEAETEPPRALVFLAGTNTKSFRVIEAGACSLFREYESFLVDTTMRIESDIVVIEQSTMMSAGGWGTSTVTERWRLEQNKPRLIGFTVKRATRNSPSQSSSDHNLLTGKQIISWQDSDTKKRPGERLLKVKPRSINVSEFVLEEELVTADRIIYEQSAD